MNIHMNDLKHGNYSFGGKRICELKYDKYQVHVK